MYMEALQDNIFERNEQSWKDAGRKGPKPQPPEGYFDRLYHTPENAERPKDDIGRPIAKDIGDLLDVDE